MNEASIAEGEYHPAADDAMSWLTVYRNHHPDSYAVHVEALASTALSGNRTAELCMSTIRRLDRGDPVSDRYLLGLTWMLRRLDDEAEMHLKAGDAS